MTRLRFCVLARSENFIWRYVKSLRLNDHNPLPALNSGADLVSYSAVIPLEKLRAGLKSLQEPSKAGAVFFSGRLRPAFIHVGNFFYLRSTKTTLHSAGPVLWAVWDIVIGTFPAVPALGLMLIVFPSADVISSVQSVSS